MGQLTEEVLRQFFADPASRALHIERLTETEDSRYLGAIGLSRRQPLFHSILGFNFSGVLSDSARFYLVPTRAEVEGKDAVVVVFRQFDRSRYQDSPEDLVAGWGTAEEAPLLEAHVDFMNGEVQRLLEIKRQQEPG
jgi:hypothetical protein